MNPTAAYGLLAFGLIFGGLVALLPLGPLRARAALLATGLALMVGIAPLMHGIFGTPSLTLLQLALLQLANTAPSPLGWRPALALTLFAAVFYPLSSAGWPMDVYAIGYQPLPLLVAISLLAGFLFSRRQHCWLIIIAIDLAGYASGLFVNLWDALLDPFLVLLALLIVGHRFVQRAMTRNSRPSIEP